MPRNCDAIRSIDQGHLPCSSEDKLLINKRQSGATPEDKPDPILWDAFGKAAPKVRQHAVLLHQAVLCVTRHLGDDKTLTEAMRLAATERGCSMSTVRRAWAVVKDSPVTDWLPILLPGYKPGGRKADMTDAAWAFFLGEIRDASAPYPLKAAYRRTADVATGEGWTWPSYDTVRRRFTALSEGERALLRNGIRAHARTFPPQMRSIHRETALGLVNIDGRKADVFVRWEDGTISRPIVIALQDIYSRRILGYEIAKTENSDATKTLLLRVFDEYGLFDVHLSDNGRAFASLKLTGGADTRRFRWPGKEIKSSGDILGLLPSLGIDVRFATPHHGQAKPIERAFRDFATGVDTTPELKAGYCGNRPDAKPEEFAGTAVPINIFRNVYAWATKEHNARRGRRTEACGGVRSFDEAFAESIKARIHRPIAPAQRRFFFHEQTICTVLNATGELKTGGFTYWSEDTLAALQPFRGKKVRILFDPAARDRPVTVLAMKDDRFIAEVPCRQRGEFSNSEHARNHARAKRQHLRAERRALEARGIMSAAKRRDIEERNGLGPSVPKPEPSPAAPTQASARVVQPTFGAPSLRQQPSIKPLSDQEAQEAIDRALMAERTKRDAEREEEYRRGREAGRRTG